MNSQRDPSSRSSGKPDEAWWAMPVRELVQNAGADPQRGLDSRQVAESRARHGSNEIEGGGPTSLWALLWESAKSPMMVLLLTVAAISLAVGQVREALVMVFVVAMYVGVHLLNKARSDRTMTRLREVQAPRTAVLRDGKLQEIPFGEVVVGDIVPLRVGTRIAADGRLLSSVGLLVDESALTGESAPVHKEPDAQVAPNAPLAERPTAVFAGTVVLDGQAKVLITAVGKDGELGRVAQLSGQAQAQPTPLQTEMSDLARTLAVAAIVVSLVIPLVALLRGNDLRQMILTWLSLTFLMVPGQPPIIIALALALASLELARKNVIVRRLHGAETLGAVTTILSDKTGTMTENRMTLAGVLLPDGQMVRADDGGQDRRLAEFLRLALPAIPVDANDPTDAALTSAAGNLQGFQPPERGRLIDQVGFSRGRVYRSLEYEQDSKESTRQLFVAGAPEFVIDHASHRRLGGDTAAWPAQSREEVKSQVRQFAEQGRRITAYGYKDGPADGRGG